METKKTEIVEKRYVTTYVATDGTEFDDQAQCAEYEKSALGVLKGRLHKIALNEGSECDIMAGSGSDESHGFVVCPKNDDEVKTIQQVMYMKSFGEWKQKHADKAGVGKPLAVFFSYDDYYAWLVDIGAMVRDMTDGKFKVVENDKEDK